MITINRLKILFTFLCQHQKKYRLNILAKELDITVRTLYSDINKLNNYLTESGYSKIENHQGILQYKGEYIDNIEYLFKHNVDYWIDFPEYRLYHLLLVMLNKKNYTTLEDFSSVLKLSRTTLLKEIDSLKHLLQSLNVDLKSKPFKGYQIVGNEVDIRNALISILDDFSLTKICIEERNPNFLNDAEYLIDILANKLKVTFSGYSYNTLLLTLWIIQLRNSSQNFINSSSLTPDLTMNEATINDHFTIFKKVLGESISIEDIYYLYMKVSESSLININKTFTEDLIYLSIRLMNFISKISSTVKYNFNHDDILFNNLLNHYRPAIKRSNTDSMLENPLYEFVVSKYRNLHHAVRKHSKVLIKNICNPFTDQELSYFTLLFASSYNQKSELIKSTNVIIVCSAGLSTSHYLKMKLENKYRVNVLGVFNSRLAYDWLNKNDVDLILSTIPFSHPSAKTLVVSPTLSEQDIRILNKHFITSQYVIDIDELISLIKKSAQINDLKQLKKDLSNYLTISIKNNRGDYKPMLLEILNTDLIKVQEKFTNKEEAVIASGKLLVDSGLAQESYIKGMLKNIEKNGNYIVIAPGIAMPHARPETGALDIGFSIITLEKPIEFGHPTNDPVKIIVGLCATDYHSHLKALSELVEILGNENLMKQIMTARTSQKLLNIIEKGVEANA